jgi:hypothetical protein
MIGAGKYDAEATRIREATGALGVVVIVVGGRLGEGMAVQATLPILKTLPDALEHVAAQIRADLARGKP